jgi:hypothetical protein
MSAREPDTGALLPVDKEGKHQLNSVEEEGNAHAILLCPALAGTLVCHSFIRRLKFTIPDFPAGC